MNNREWLYSLEPDALAAWFEAEHSDAAGAEQAPMMGHTPECDANGTAECESDGADANIGSPMEPRDYAGPIEDLYDSREKLEADVREASELFALRQDCSGDFIGIVIALLDRQAEITRHEVEKEHADEIYNTDVVRGMFAAKASDLQIDLEAAYAKNRSLRAHIKKMQEGRNGWHIKARKLQEEIDELEKQVGKLKAEREGWRMRCGKMLDAMSVARSIADEWDEG